MIHYNLVLKDPNLKMPIANPLCGAFAGPGSRAMAVSRFNGVCLPFNGWFVFQYVDGNWQRVLGGDHETTFVGLVKSGNNIVEKNTIQYPGESVCTASGVRSRVWHWNGSQLVAGSWKVISIGPTTLHVRNFASPSGNLSCELGDEDKVYCSSFVPRQSVTLSHNGRFTVCTAQLCGLRAKASGIQTLAYGKQDVFAGYRCRSEMQGITCTVLSGASEGKGFLINAAGVTKVGTH
jgi:hypothetical protein